MVYIEWIRRAHMVHVFVSYQLESEATHTHIRLDRQTDDVPKYKSDTCNRDQDMLLGYSITYISLNFNILFIIYGLNYASKLCRLINPLIKFLK